MSTDDTDRTFMVYQIDTAAGLSPAEARRNAKLFARAARRLPAGIFSLVLPGFDDDPRELPDIPEARAFLRHFALQLARKDRDETIAGQLAPEAATLLALCTGDLPREAVAFGRIGLDS